VIIHRIHNIPCAFIHHLSIQDSRGVPYRGVVDTFTRILAEGSDNSATSAWRWRVFFRGVGPRVLFISIGGFVFFGAYERAGYLLDTLVT